MLLCAINGVCLCTCVSHLMLISITIAIFINAWVELYASIKRCVDACTCDKWPRAPCENHALWQAAWYTTLTIHTTPYTDTNTHMYISTDKCAYTYLIVDNVYIHVHQLTYMNMQVHTYAYLRIRVHVCEYMWIYVPTQHTCTYIYVHIHTHEYS